MITPPRLEPLHRCIRLKDTYYPKHRDSRIARRTPRLLDKYFKSQLFSIEDRDHSFELGLNYAWWDAEKNYVP